MQENPYEASLIPPNVTEERHVAIPMTVTWPRIWRTTFITTVIMVAVFLILAGCTPLMEALFVCSIRVCKFLFGREAAENNGPSFPMGVCALVVFMPFVMLTLTVFISVLRFICRIKKQPSTIPGAHKPDV